MADRNGKGKGEGMGNGKGTGIDKQTLGGDDISCAVACCCGRKCMWQTQTARPN